MTVHINAGMATISVSDTSARAAYPPGNKSGVTVFNTSLVPVFVKSGDENVTATLSDQVVPAESRRTFEKNPSDTHMAAIAAESETATIYFCGEGV